MKVLVFSIDSDIGRGIVVNHQTRGDDVTAFSRRQEGLEFDVLVKSTWKHIECDRVYYTITGTNKNNEAESMNVGSLASMRFLQWFGEKSMMPTEFVVLSSYLGSIHNVNCPTDVVYRMTKSALNMGIKCLSMQQTKHKWLLLNPGLVYTKMTAAIIDSGSYPYGGSPLSVAVATAKLIESVNSRKFESGAFYDSLNNTRISW